MNDKMYIEAKSGAELYLMKSKEAKEGKVYVFSRKLELVKFF